MMHSFFSKSFSTSAIKHFKDNRFANLTAIAQDNPSTLAKVFQAFAHNNINLSYLRTHCLDLKLGEQRKYKLQMSYRKDPSLNFPQAKIDLEKNGILVEESELVKVPWFPKDYSDMDMIGRTLLQVNQSRDHPQFQDAVYLARRNYIANISKEYKLGQQIPDIEYTKQETQFWCQIYRKLTSMHQKAMSSRYLRRSEEINKELNLSKRIPQLRELSEYIHSRTGFRIKPTHGILSQREFLNGFAFKYFCSTQFIRNFTNPDYTPEPDLIHEVMGHIVMLADPDIAAISHKIGLLSLGASDEDIARLGTLYWYTMEFGVCKQGDKIRGYGAGIASSIGEINNMLSDAPKFKKLDIFKDCTAKYISQEVQTIYRVTESFTDAIKELQAFGSSILKPITTVFNEKTGQIQYDRAIEGIHIEDPETSY